jgi:hypothetical protein
MSDDLVQRLREGLEIGAIDMADIMDAADEIARLREENKHLRSLDSVQESRITALERHLART